MPAAMLGSPFLPERRWGREFPGYALGSQEVSSAGGVVCLEFRRSIAELRSHPERSD